MSFQALDVAPGPEPHSLDILRGRWIAAVAGHLYSYPGSDFHVGTGHQDRCAAPVSEDNIIMNAYFRSENRFCGLQTKARPLIACYLPVADPLIQGDIKTAYWEGGADILELGVPTSNPFMDGPDVASTMQRSLEGSIDPIASVLALSDWTRSHAERPASVCMAYPDLDFDRLYSSGGLHKLDGILLLGLNTRPDR